MSSSNTSGPGGVRNLRAMFENKSTSEHSTSPPSRGRSPESVNIQNNRPLSKVRASFVAVEKPGELGQAPQWGLRKASDVISTSGIKRNETSEMEVPTQDLGMVMKGHPFEPSATAHTPKPKDAVSHPASSNIQNKAIPKLKTNGDTSAIKNPASNVAKTKGPVSPNPSKTPITQLTTTKTATTVKPPPIKQATPKLSEKPPVITKSPKVPTIGPAPHIKGIRGGPAKIRSVMESANKAAENRTATAAASEKGSSAPKPNQTVKRDSLPETNGVKKEQSTSPKTTKTPTSPTKPTRLPAAATAPTAASVARTEPAAPPASTSTADRRTSSVKKDPAPPRVANTTTVSSMAKRTPRASLQPQTNGQQKDRPKSRSRISTTNDEGFLARMMRPTTSSQQKAHDKAPKPDSPPRATRKVSDKTRKSMGTGKERADNKENEAGSPVEPTKQTPEVQSGPAEPTVAAHASTLVAQDAM